jgi:hypothetical protein
VSTESQADVCVAAPEKSEEEETVEAPKLPALLFIYDSDKEQYQTINSADALTTTEELFTFDIDSGAFVTFTIGESEPSSEQ